MLVKFYDWLLVICSWPNHEFVVITTRGELFLVKTPLESTDLLLMTGQFGFISVMWSQISVKDFSVTRTGANAAACPCNSADPTIMAMHSSNNFTLVYIPDLKKTCMSTDCQCWTSLRPLDTGNWVIGTKVIQFCNFRVCSWPEVHAWTKANCKDIGTGPVY